MIFAVTTSEQRGLTGLVREFWPLLLPTALGFLALYVLLPRVRRSGAAWGTLLAGVALAALLIQLARIDAIWQEQVLFLTFSGIAVIGGFLLVSQQNPAHAALSFTLVIISTCGLFLLNGAPFLMAATLIIYAGAIIVTFLFVLMLAQQAGLTDADARSREPFLSCLAGFVLLAAILCVLERSFEQREGQGAAEKLRRVVRASNVKEAYEVLGEPSDKEGSRTLNSFPELGKLFPDDEDVDVLNLEETRSKGDLSGMKESAANLLRRLAMHGNLTQPPEPPNGPTSRPLAVSPFSGRPSSELPRIDPETGRVTERLPGENVRTLGTSLFTDYLVPVLAAAVLLLVATIGPIAIASRGRAEGLR